MANDISLKEAAQQTVAFRETLTKSGLLERMHEIAAAADPYIRQAWRAKREMEPPTEQVGQNVRPIAPNEQQVGKLLLENHEAIENALKAAEELRTYVAGLETTWRNLVM